MASADPDWSLIDGMFDAVLERELWDRVLCQLAGGFDDRPAVLKRQHFASKRVEVIHTANLDPAYRQAHQTGMFADPEHNGAYWLHKAGRPGRFLRWSRVFPESRFQREEASFELVYHPAGISFDWVVRLDSRAEGVSVFGFHRRLDQAPMPDQDYQRIAPLVPYFARAMALMAQYDTLDASLATLEAAMANCGVGALLLDMHGNVHFLNETADQLIRAGNGLSIRHGRLVALDHATDIALSQLVLAVGQTGAGGGGDQGSAGGTLTLPRPPPDVPLVVEVAPIATGRHCVAGPRPAAVVTIRDPGAELADGMTRLARDYRLSPTQARVAALLVEGKRHAAIADELAIARNTVKTHVRRVYHKLDCRSQAELVRLARGRSRLPDG